MAEPPTDPSQFVTCRCHHCDGHIEFDASHAGESIECPHCRVETKLFVPRIGSSPPLASEDSTKVRPKIKRSYTPLILIPAVLVVGIVCVFLFVFYIGKDRRETWIKSSSIQQGDVQISIINTVDFEGRFISPLNGQTYNRQTSLGITLEIKNSSSSIKIDFSTWRGSESSNYKDFAMLTDNYQNSYKSLPLSFYPGLYPQSVYPGNSIRDDLVFEAPVTNIEWLHLELPATNFGGVGMMRFEIPVSAIKQDGFD